jgi:peptidoglycan/LPS O-acetylase OafA/YrhL
MEIPKAAAGNTTIYRTASGAATSPASDGTGSDGPSATIGAATAHAAMQHRARPGNNSWLSGRLTPAMTDKLTFDYDLEGLRGFAALGVMMAHGLGMFILDDTWHPGGIVPYFSVGGLAVNLFFILSGFVIGESAIRKGPFKTGSYYLKRWVRIYPIYLLAFSSLLLLGTTNTPWQTIGNLLMLQNSNSYFNLAIPLEKNIVPIWSINYEILYYLVFPLIVLYRPNIRYLLGALILTSIFGYFFHVIPPFLSDYAIGYLFWIAGLIIVWRAKPARLHTFRFLSYAFLMMACNHFNIGNILLKAFGMYSGKESALGIDVLFNLPVCLLVFCEIAKRELPYKKVFTGIAYGLPLLLILYLTKTHRLLQDIRWIACTILYALSVILYGEKKISTYILHKLQFTGSISYAIYAFHFPLALLVNKYLPFKGTLYAWCSKFIIWMALTYLLSYWTERILQPRIKKLFFKRPLSA